MATYCERKNFNGKGPAVDAVQEGDSWIVTERDGTRRLYWDGEFRQKYCRVFIAAKGGPSGQTDN